MTREEFAKLEKICKNAWLELAESGSDIKPKSIGKFLHGCPACEITSAVEARQTSPYKKHNCLFCPITEWRELAKRIDADNILSSFYDETEYLYQAACEEDGQAYESWEKATEDWDHAPDILKAKAFARAIAEMEWSWIDEYEKADMSQFLKEDK
jgi:hypothetical protein